MRRLRLHFRVVSRPEDLDPAAEAVLTDDAVQSWIDNQLEGCRQLFAEISNPNDGGGPVEIVPVDRRPADFQRGTVRISCSGASLTQDQVDLLGDRGGFGSNDVLIAVAVSVEGPWLGCAAHPPDQPGLVILAEDTSRRWVLAHELGHILDLPDVGVPVNLMCGSPSMWPTNDIPKLDSAQVDTILEASLRMNS